MDQRVGVFDALVACFGVRPDLIHYGRVRIPYTYGRKLIGYEVSSLTDRLAKAGLLGISIFVQPYSSSGQTAAIVEFSGGYRDSRDKQLVFAAQKADGSGHELPWPCSRCSSPAHGPLCTLFYGPDMNM